MKINHGEKLNANLLIWNITTNNMASQPNQIYLSVLKTAIHKALNKNLPQILADAVGYLEDNHIQVKQRKKRKPKLPQNMSDLQKKTQSVSAQKMKTTAYINLNTNRINSDSQKIKDTYPTLQFGKLKQDDEAVWVCGTPGHLENTLNILQRSDEKSSPIFEPLMETILESIENPGELGDDDELECLDCKKRFGTEEDCLNHKCKEPGEPENDEKIIENERQVDLAGLDKPTGGILQRIDLILEENPQPKKLKRREKVISIYD